MKFLCSLWLCLGKGSGKVVEEVVGQYAKPKDDALVADGDVEVKRFDAGKERRATDITEPPDTVAWQSGSLEPGKDCEEWPRKSPCVTIESTNREGQTVLAADLLCNERTLQALLQKAKVVLSEQNQAFSLERPTGKSPAVGYEAAQEPFSHTTDPKLAYLNAQLLEACSVPKPDAQALLRVELLLGEVRRWLAARPCPAAATAVLYAAGDGLVHAEHAVRSVGLVRFWQPEHMTVFLALLQLYADLLVQANQAAQLQRMEQQQRQERQQGSDEENTQQHGQGQGQERSQQGPQRRQLRHSTGGSSSDVVLLAADQERVQKMRPQQQQQPSSRPQRQVSSALMPQTSEISLPYSEQDRGCGGSSVPPQSQSQPIEPQRPPPEVPPLTFAVAALLLRPDWLDLMVAALELLHFSPDYREAAGRAGREAHEALGQALQLWSFLTQLVKFAAAHADAVQRTEPCLQRLGALLAPPGGAVPRLLELPLAKGTLVAQLHALWLLQVLYDMPDAKVLYSAPLADYYVALHHNAMVTSYEASAGDPNSASAELCRIHATLLRSLARHPGAPVRSAFAGSRTVEWLLREVSLECQLLAAAAGQEADDEGGETLSSDDGDSPDGGDSGDDNVGTDITLSSSDVDGDSGGACGTIAAAAAAPNAGGSLGQEPSGLGVPMRPLSPVMAAEVAQREASAAEGKGAEVVGRSAAAAGPRKAGKRGFSFTYDLNEDVERLIALEDELGQEMELDGFEFDEEGKRLKARSDALQAVAAASAAAAAEPPPMRQAAVAAGPQELCSNVSFAGSSPSRRSSGVPRLALVGLRTASLSSMTGSSPAVAGRQPAGGARTSQMGNSAPSASSHRDVAGSDGDEFLEPSSDEARTPSPDAAAAATAAERLAAWSSTLVEAYKAASAGDASRLPYPPPRSRSRANSGLGVPGAHQQGDGGAVPKAEQQQPLPPQRPGSVEGAPEAEPACQSARARELTTGSAVHAGPQGELHLMVQSFGVARRSATSCGATAAAGAGAGSHGRPPLPTKPPALPPLRMGSGLSEAAAAGAAAAQANPLSARAPPPPPPALGSSRAMMVLSASNRFNNASGSFLASPNGAAQHAAGAGASAVVASPPSPTAAAAPPVHDLTRQFHSQGEGWPHHHHQHHHHQHQQLQHPHPPPVSFPSPKARATTAAAPAPTSACTDSRSPSPRRPPQPLIPALNLNSIRRRDGGAAAAATTDTGRTVPLSSMLRATNAGSLSHYSGRDSATTLLRSGGTTNANTPASSGNTAATASTRRSAGRISSGGGGGRDEGGPLGQAAEADGGGGAVAAAATSPSQCSTGSSGGLQRVAEAGGEEEEGEELQQRCRPPGVLYQELACQRLLYQDRATHLLLLKVLVDLLVAPSGGLDPAYVPQYPAHAGAPHTEFVLLWHLNAPRNAAVVHELCRGAQRRSAQQAAAAATRSAVAAAAAAPASPASASRARAVTRALQLLSRPLFDAARYTNLQFVARGAYGDVFRARMEPPRPRAWPSPTPPAAAAAGAGGCTAAAAAAAGGGPMQVVIKTLQLPTSAHDPGVLAGVFGEVSVMERFAGHDCICQLLDYGMRDDAYWIVMRRYRCSLAEWRARQKPLGDLAAAIGGGSAAVAAATVATTAARVYLSALAQVVDALRLLASHHVVHFDLKCSNILIEPLPGVRDGELWASVGGGGARHNESDAVPFRCVLADFGEARAYRCAEEAFTARNRGTEVFKSPEMLMLNAAGRPSGRMLMPPPPPLNQHQQQQQQNGLSGAGLASDIWSLGCLAYELLTGSVLFGGDYASVTHRVAFGAGERLTLTASERARLADLPELVGLVEWILARDPAKRPSLEQIRTQIDQIRATLLPAPVAAAQEATPT